jgi:hypothetical protein
MQALALLRRDPAATATFAAVSAAGDAGDKFPPALAAMAAATGGGMAVFV